MWKPIVLLAFAALCCMPMGHHPRPVAVAMMRRGTPWVMIIGAVMGSLLMAWRLGGF